MKDKSCKENKSCFKITTSKSSPQHLNMSNYLNLFTKFHLFFSITWSFSKNPEVTGVKTADRLVMHFDFYLVYLPVSSPTVAAGFHYFG